MHERGEEEEEGRGGGGGERRRREEGRMGLYEVVFFDFTEISVC